MFKSVDVAEYYGGSMLTRLWANDGATFERLKTVLGEPWYNNGVDYYPDDDYKTDVCWCVESTENPEHIVTIWNYKNGPSYNEGESDGAYTIEGIPDFSVYYSDEGFWNKLRDLIVGGSNE